jgi:YNFM family putative membrane transporter
MTSMDYYIQKGSKGYWSTIAALFLGSFVTFALLYCFQPLIPVFSSSYGIAPSIASLSISLTTASMAIAMLFMSSFSDLKGRKSLMVISLIGSTVLTLILPFIENFYLLLFLRVLQGILIAGYPAIAMTYIQEEFDPAITGTVMGIFVSGNSIGGLLGRLIVSTVSDFYSWQVAIGCIGIICGGISLWFFIKLPASQNFKVKNTSRRQLIAKFRENLQCGELICFYLIAFCVMGSFVALYNYVEYPLIAPPYSLSQTVVGFIFVIYLCGTFSSIFLGKIADRRGAESVLLFSLFLMLVGVLITLLMPLMMKIFGIAVFTFGFFGSHSIASSCVVKVLPHGKVQSSALYLLFYYVGSSFLGSLGGEFLLWYGWEGVVFLISIAISIAMVISFLLLLHKRKNK